MVPFLGALSVCAKCRDQLNFVASKGLAPTSINVKVVLDGYIFGCQNLLLIDFCFKSCFQRPITIINNMLTKDFT